MTGVTIAEQVAAMAAATAGQPPREVMDVMAHERAELAARGIPEGIVSPQRPDGSLSMREKQDLTLTVLSDPGSQVARAAGVLSAPSGARVALLARSAGQLDEAAGTARERGGVAQVFPADAADPAQVAGAVTRITAELGRVSILVSNAAVVWPVGPTADVTLDQWRAAFAVNVGAVFQLGVAVLPSMLERGWGGS